MRTFPLIWIYSGLYNEIEKFGDWFAMYFCSFKKMEDSISDSPLPELEVKAFKPLITSSIVKSGRLNSTYFLLEKLLNLGFDLKKFLT